MDVTEHSLHLEREDITVTGEFVESDDLTTASMLPDHDGHFGHSKEAMFGGHEHAMKPFLHSSYGDVLLFKDWLLASCTETTIAIVVLFFLAIVYEAVKTYQVSLLTKKTSHSNCYPVASTTSGDSCHEDYPWLRQMFSWVHLVSTIVHMIQITIGYALMLAVMTYNVHLIVAVVTGSGVGFLLFSWRRRSPNDSYNVDNCYLNKSFVGDFSSSGFK
ncbi:High affinity copper uptake protein 1 [Halotydeus destructor]|nr:High affinity copper uptake protein 1 [Halotydeus destructor]